MAAPKWKEAKFKAGDDATDADFPDYEVVEHRIGNQTNADSNANKFFSLELHKSTNGKYRVYSNYGRVSDDEFTGAVGVYGPGTEHEARAFFETKFKAKVRPSKGYEEVEFVRPKVGSPASRSVVKTVKEEDVPDDKKQKFNESQKKAKKIPPLKLSTDVKRLVSQWYKENSHSITSNAAVKITSDGIETALGVLSFKQIEKGRDILSDLSQAIKDDSTKDIRDLSSDFYSKIPAKLGRKISDADLITSDALVTQKFDLLQLMEDALEVGGASFMAGVDQQYRDINADIKQLAKTSREWKRVDKKIQSTRGHNHYHTTSTVKNVFEVSLNADHSRYDACDVDNEQELFHGSRNCNILGILSRGLMIAPPQAPVSGYMFAKGGYFADSSTKSINYSMGVFNGSYSSKNYFLFLCKVKLGKQKLLKHSDYNASKYCLNGGDYDSVKGCKGSSLIHNEYIVYTLPQMRITHIVELER